MTLEDTNRLKGEINLLISAGYSFLNCDWLDMLTEKAKTTLNEYCFDAPNLTRRDISIMLHKNKDSELWDIIMDR